MSSVDNVILTFASIEETEPGDGPYRLMGPINAWLTADTGQRFGPDLGEVGGAYGGSKALEAPLFVAAFNYWHEKPFMDFLRTLPWEYPESVQVIVKRQDDEQFQILTLE